MTREQFTGLFLGFIIKKFPAWLPEEATEEYMLNVMQENIQKHNCEIKRILKRNNVIKS